MKILSLHCDYIKFKPLKKAISKPEELSEEGKKEIEVKEPLGIFVAVEKSDGEDLKRVIEQLVENILDLKDKVKAEKIVIYPYAHLSANLSDPAFAQDVLQGAEVLLKKKKIEVFRAPFGYYKEFELKCKGHPLAELSRSFGSEINRAKKEGKEPLRLQKEEEYNPRKLLASISKSKLDTSKLKENDHRIIGKNLDLWSFSEMAPGMAFWHNNGLIIYNELVKYWREEHEKEGYSEISTPQVMDRKLWEISGHWRLYNENMFTTKYDERDFAVKPMNCPGGMIVYKLRPRSYKELPIRIGELGIVHRQELSGTLAGLFRVIKFTQDDAHIFCTEEQLEGEIIGVIKLFQKMLGRFGFKDYKFTLSVRGKEKKNKYLGDDKIWDKAEETLSSSLKKIGLKFERNEGEAKFYGPSLDVAIKDSLGREWQCSTLQLDFNIPGRFELKYMGEDGKEHTPIMLHRVVYGSLDRFIGVLTEHLNGNFPIWLSPIQVRVLSFTDRNEKVAKKVLNELKAEGIRADADFGSSTIGDKVRTASMLKIPYIITIGDKEEEKGTIAIKKRGETKPRFGLKLDKFLKEVKREFREREY